MITDIRNIPFDISFILIPVFPLLETKNPHHRIGV